MANKSKSPSNEGIQATNINAQAIAVGKGAKAVVNYSKVADDVIQVFVELEKKVENLPDSPDKEVAHTAVNALKAEAKLGDNAKEENVSKWINFLAQMAPDIWEVAVASFANPVAGLGIAFSKVAQLAKEEKRKA